MLTAASSKNAQLKVQTFRSSDKTIFSTNYIYKWAEYKVELHLKFYIFPRCMPYDDL
jgi:hypothetical protein